MILPNFVCVGAQKSATTTLHTILTQHPNIYLPKVKETKFFLNYGSYEKGIRFYSQEYFGDWAGQKAVGEFCPEYMYFEYVAKRLYEYFGPELKIISTLRNPADRAYSHYLMSKRRTIENEKFEKAIELEHKRINHGGCVVN